MKCRIEATHNDINSTVRLAGIIFRAGYVGCDEVACLVEFFDLNGFPFLCHTEQLSSLSSLHGGR